ncbi:hypothetical protein MTO96_019567 [Rhipicephalus appendiculatus]
MGQTTQIVVQKACEGESVGSASCIAVYEAIESAAISAGGEQCRGPFWEPKTRETPMNGDQRRGPEPSPFQWGESNADSGDIGGGSALCLGLATPCSAAIPPLFLYWHRGQAMQA